MSRRNQRNDRGVDRYLPTDQFNYTFSDAKQNMSNCCQEIQIEENPDDLLDFANFYGKQPP